MTKAIKPDAWLLETLMSIHVSKDTSVGSPGVAITATIPGRRGAQRYHWPTVQGHLRAPVVDDIAAAVAELVRGRLLVGGYVQEVLPID